VSPADPLRSSGRHAAVPAGRPAPTRPARPELRVVDEDARRRRSRWRRLGLLASLVAFVGVLAAVSLHVFVVQSQFELDELQARVAQEQASYERNRLAVAELASPDRVVAAAAALGMVEPNEVTYLTADDPTAATTAGTPAATGATGPQDDPAAGGPTDADADGAATAEPPPPVVLPGLAERWIAMKELLVPGP
jgi:cell division protein FtsL